MDMTFSFMTLANGSFTFTLNLKTDEAYIPNLTDQEAWDLMRHIQTIPTVSTYLTGSVDFESISKKDISAVAEPSN